MFNFNDLQVDGNTIITGNLTVNGTSTTLNVATLDVEDLNITVAKAATTSAATDGAGLTFGAWSSGTIPTLTWIHSNNRFAMTKALAAQGFVANLLGNVTGNVTGDVTGNLTGNADTATALATSRNISGVAFNGTADITLNTSAITENTNLYYTNARADARIAAASIDDLSDVDTTYYLLQLLVQVSKMEWFRMGTGSRWRSWWFCNNCTRRRFSIYQLQLPH